MLVPLELPEIRKHIGVFLEKLDLAQCVRVNKAWNTDFLPQLWEKLELQSFLYEMPVVNVQRLRQQKQLEFLDKHRDFVKHIRFKTPWFSGFSYLDLGTLPNLEDVSLALADNFWLEKFLEFISMNPSIRRLQLTRVSRLSPVFWEKLLSACPRLEYLSLRRVAVEPAPAEHFYALCSQLRHLELHKVILPPIPLPIAHDAFRHLRILHIEKSVTGYTVGDMMQLISGCPELEKLRWENPYKKEISLFEDTIRKFSRLAVTGAWYRLENLHLSRAYIDDMDLAGIVSSLRRIRCLDVEGTKFGYLSFEALRPHLKEIEVLNLHRCRNVDRAAIVEILLSCPQLRVFKGRRIHAKDVVSTHGDISYRTWVCTSLRELALSFEFEQGVTEEEQLNKDRMMTRVFEQLSRLTKLETLNLGGYKATGTSPDSEMQLSLSKGFGKLSTLRGMKYICAPRTGQDIGENEVNWMIKHWEELEVFDG
ncbi:hypothetical protein BGX27_002056, partial [Mortierella sp. AM989]